MELIPRYIHLTLGFQSRLKRRIELEWRVELPGFPWIARVGLVFIQTD